MQGSCYIKFSVCVIWECPYWHGCLASAPQGLTLKYALPCLAETVLKLNFQRPSTPVLWTWPSASSYKTCICLFYLQHGLGLDKECSFQRFWDFLWLPAKWKLFLLQLLKARCTATPLALRNTSLTNNGSSSMSEALQSRCCPFVSHLSGSATYEN